MREILFPISLIWITYVGVGSLIEYFIEKIEKKIVHGVSPFPFWFLLGAVGTTFGQFLFSQISVSLSISFFFFLVLGVLGLYLRRTHWWIRPNIDWNVKHLLLWSIIIVFSLFFFTRSVSRVMYTWDSIAFWVPKMSALWSENVVRAEALVPFNHPEYPLLLPLTGANAFLLTQTPNDVAAKGALFGFTIALLWSMGSWLYKKIGGWKAIFWMVLFISLFIFREHVAGEYVGTADILVGTYMCAGTLALLYKRPLLAQIFWLSLPWVKSEGLVFAGVTSFLLFIYYPHLRLWMTTVGTFLLLPWRFFIQAIHVDSSQYFKFGELYARPWVEYAVYSIHAFREELRNLQKWNLLFFFFITLSFTRFKEICAEKSLHIIYTGLAVQLVMYMVIFTVAPEEQASFIAAAVSRLTLHLAPTVLIMSSYLHAKKYQTA